MLILEKGFVVCCSYQRYFQPRTVPLTEVELEKPPPDDVGMLEPCEKPPGMLWIIGLERAINPFVRFGERTRPATALEELVLGADLGAGTCDIVIGFAVIGAAVIGLPNTFWKGTGCWATI